ncbi:MAG TPA: GGDEF domain-containing protein [Burkholderiaceae bacterium]
MLTALRRASPVVVDVPVDVRYQLMRRYLEVSVRNSGLGMLSFALVLFGLGYEAAWGTRLLGFALMGVVTIARLRLAHALERRMDPADPRSDGAHDALVLTTMLIWGTLPFWFAGQVSAANLAVVVYASLVALAVQSVSYIVALPACMVGLASTTLPLVAFMLSRDSFLDAMMALATLMYGFAFQSRLRVGHRALLEALGAQRENAMLVKELEGYRLQLEHENARLGDSLRDASLAAERDPLTGLFNRRYLASFTQPLAGMVLEEQEAVTIGIVDIDHFKRVNDVHGHLVGDQVLRGVARLLGERLRERDCLVRYGGEEFVIVLRRCNIQRGLRVAEALRHNIASADIDTDDGIVPATVSVGVAQWAPGETLDEVIQRADRVLYRAKQSGRDRVEIDAKDALNYIYVPNGDSTLPGQLH